MTTTAETLSAEKKLQIIELAKQSIGDIWSHPKGPRGGKDYYDFECCEYCGKKVGGKSNTRYVQILTDGSILPKAIFNIATEQDLWDLQDEIGHQPQGGFALGSECIKKLLGSNLEAYSFL
jgi:hypothetical protein